jgi:hypothetical protein
LPWRDAALLEPVSAWPSRLGTSVARSASPAAMGVVFQTSGNDPAASSFVRLKAVGGNGKNEKLDKSFGIQMASFRERTWQKWIFLFLAIGRIE